MINKTKILILIVAVLLIAAAAFNPAAGHSHDMLPETGLNMIPVVIAAALGVILLVVISLVSGKTRKVFLVLLILLAIGLLSYSVASIVINSNNNRNAARKSAEILSEMEFIDKFEDKTVDEALAEQSKKEIDDREMDKIIVNNYYVIGTLQIPAFGLEFPVSAEVDDSLLNCCPCRYKGTTFADNLIISAHNYSYQFGKIKDLTKGDQVIFTDVYGDPITYEVLYTETLGAYDKEAMESGDWDLTLFTCTPGGVNRVTVRCARVS